MLIPNIPITLNELFSYLGIPNWQSDLSPVTHWIQNHVAKNFSSIKQDDIEIIFSQYCLLNQQEQLTAIVDEEQGYNVVMQAAKLGFDSFLEKNSERLLPVVVNQQSQPHHHTALHLAALEGHGSIIELLLERNADPNIENNFGQVPIHFAAVLRENVSKKNKENCVRLLLPNTNPNAMLKTGKGNPLIFSLMNFDNLPLLQDVLTRCPALIESVDSLKQNMLHYAIIHKQHKIINYLLAHEKAKFLLEQKTKNFSTPLILACRYGDAEIVEKLIQHPTCVKHIDSKDEHFQTALDWAHTKKNEESIKLLLDINAKCDNSEVDYKPPLSF